MPFILIIFIQILCGVHVIRTNQERFWLYLIIGLPGIGCTIYTLSIILPGFFGSHYGQQGVSRILDKIAPERHINRQRDALMISENSENYTQLADELARLGRLQEAIQNYRKALTGIFEHDPTIMAKLAKVQFDNNDPIGCEKTLSELIMANPDFRSQDCHLLYARAQQQMGNLDKAEEEYRVLVEYYTGPEARFRYYEMLCEKGDLISAKQQLETIAIIARRSKPHYRKLHKVWLQQAYQELHKLN
ncbi:hypothetical protein [Xenorhabdus innexi]|uniref:Tetratricopeptide TPR_2 repeat protein n=1 Tax=Xenorhabdus innexi TaxID=290109 RepID=A0A1N6MWA0_9GAMM|nr:hypothetical protein [Xenorhabdus innexi]PHM37472.1 hypothetical protein Xinn_00848 [Xenorhabdus innexi]SIP73054.1 Tetratricopeptide TPR_2 repeat protein [Xenorhabdus innexi]